MTDKSADTFPAPRQERVNRIRIGATGLATVVIIVLLAASFFGTASNEPELTPEAMAEQAAQDEGNGVVEEELPQEPLAELGVAPGTGPVEEPVVNDDAEALADDSLGS